MADFWEYDGMAMCARLETPAPDSSCEVESSLQTSNKAERKQRRKSPPPLVEVHAVGPEQRCRPPGSERTGFDLMSGCEALAWCVRREQRQRLHGCGEMAGTSVASIVTECHISVSQEELLANLHGGWERYGHYSLDESPSQTAGIQSQNLRSLDPNSPFSYNGDQGDSESEASESVDGEAHLVYTQEPVEWISPSDSPQAGAGAEAKEDSYVAAFESDRSQSQSPSQDWHGEAEPPHPQAQTPNSDTNAEFLTQPALGVLDFQFSPSEDLEQDILPRQTIPVQFQASAGSSLLLLPPILENEVSVIEAPACAMESCAEPFTQALESQGVELLNYTQEPANRLQSLEGRHEIFLDHTALGTAGPFTKEPRSEQGKERDELVRESLAVMHNEDRRLSQDDDCYEISRDTSHVETHRGGGSGVREKAQPVMQRSQEVEVGTGRTPSSSEPTQNSDGVAKSLPKSSKRADFAEETHGEQKRQRKESSISLVRAQSFPKTVMDVVRSRSRSLSYSLVDDERNILSMIMRAGVSFPPFAHEKRSV